MSEDKLVSATEALDRFVSDMGLGSPKFDDDYELRLAEARALLEPRRTVGFKRLASDAIVPTKAHATDSGFDLYAADDVIIEPGETSVVPTGIAVQLPPGMEAQVRPRSGVTSKTKLRVQLGTIDNGFTGGIGVIVDNTAKGKPHLDDNWYALDTTKQSIKTCSHYPFNTHKIRKGDRIAQLVVQYLPQVSAVEIDGDLTETRRGSCGFGSSGV